MRGHGTTWRATAIRLANEHGLPTLCTALIGRLTLDNRVADARELARLFTEIRMGTEGDLDLDFAEDLARRCLLSVLARALIDKLVLDGAQLDAQRMALLFKTTRIGDDDYDDVIISA